MVSAVIGSLKLCFRLFKRISNHIFPCRWNVQYIFGTLVSSKFSHFTEKNPWVYGKEDFLWFIRCILGKFTASFVLNSRKETQSLASAGSKILGLSTLVIEQGLKQRVGCSLIPFFNPILKLSE